ISIVTPLFNLWRTIGLYDTWPGLIIPYLSQTLPISIYTLAAYFQQIPWDLERAAQVDGATTFEAFRKVIVPLAMPGVFTTAIIAFFIAWNDFVYGISLTSTAGARPVPAALAFFTGASQFEEPTGAISAAAIIVTIPIVIIVVLFQRQIVSGLTQGELHGNYRDPEPGQEVRRRLPRRQRREPGHRRRGVRDPGRALGLRQVDPAAHDRRTRGHHRGGAAHRRQARQRGGAA